MAGSFLPDASSITFSLRKSLYPRPVGHIGEGRRRRPASAAQWKYVERFPVFPAWRIAGVFDKLAKMKNGVKDGMLFFE
ncbi:hypothetical protein QYH69_02550 [Paraburkholderia sp. SARCC-3016]|uniref:hypothetical protein n=1 Tax=Paraburkholderia sp. SARCC-3016 TaxID=3058611 RepID=UPI00280676C8|nr:hypothetical protein [Paraburkholderia sp. SARCC-3016]MDQ7976123.1 hypothetical protein [Paraburkholderia sp. SARCC-3016]